MLTLDDLGLLLKELVIVSPKWYHLGLLLKMRPDILDSIRIQFFNFNDQLLEMLKAWLTTSDNTSWKTLIDALRSENFEEHRLAIDLEKKYCLVEGTEVHESKH